MVLRIILFAMMALGLGGFGIIAWVSTRPPAAVAVPSAPTAETVPAQAAAPEPPRPPAKVTVLVAARPVRAGSLLKPEEITAHELDQAEAPADASPDTQSSRQALVGAMIRRPLATGEPLLPADLMRPGDRGFLAAVLGGGMRAVTIGVDAVSGAAGLIWPGDRVDVIMTQAQDDPSIPLGRRISAQIVQRNARVIAIDQQLVQGTVPGGADGSTARTVTIEVAGDQAQRVQLAARIGKLSLSVRASDSSEFAEDEQTAIFASDVSSALAGVPPRATNDVMRVHSGTTESKEYRFR